MYRLYILKKNNFILQMIKYALKLTFQYKENSVIL